MTTQQRKRKACGRAADAGAYCSSCAADIMAKALNPRFGGRRKKGAKPVQLVVRQFLEGRIKSLEAVKPYRPVRQGEMDACLPNSFNRTNLENGMSLIPKDFSLSIVALGIASPANPIQFIATGFLYSQLTGEDESGHPLYATCLVTNRHVIEGRDQLLARLDDEQSSTLRLSGPWAVHPDPEIDVAVTPFPLDDPEGNKYRVSSFRSDSQTSFCQDLQDIEFREGDEVYTLGFPLGLAGHERNYPIARQGVVARIRDWYEGQSDFFLIDASIFPGNSGGPVIAKPTMFSYGQNRAHSRLIGVVSGYLPHEDVARSDQTGRPVFAVMENSGLATVVPIDKVKETIMLAVEQQSPERN